MDSHTTNAQNAHAQTLDAEKKARLAELVKELAVVHGKVTLSSGKEADYYVDLRRATCITKPPVSSAPCCAS